ncbi:glycoside hydrolase family 3 C-terminal domain-containing protein [bacterium]|nr:glycoside hydrolase family 3 C-terminal domain-containing protein [bacterium]
MRTHLSLAALIVLGAVSFAFAESPAPKPEHAALCRRAAAEGMVLLENKSYALPLATGEKVALIGKAQIHFSQTGWGSGYVNAYYSVNFLKGAENRAEKGQLTFCSELADKYKAEENYFPTLEELQTVAKDYPAAFVFISRNCGEGSARQLSKGDYYLTDEEEKLLDITTKAGFSKVIVVINSGALIDLSFEDRYPIDALMLVWQPGMEGGNAFWDVALGDVSPCGKLADTIPKSYKDYPSSSCFRESNEYTEYREDVYVGYRYFETFDPQGLKVRYPFGYGLSYTKFMYESLNPAIDDEKFSIEITIRNVGPRAGREVLQVYYSRPQGRLGNPAIELAAYKKTKLLLPNESETLTISFPLEQMKTFQESPQRCFILEKGTYNIYVGNSVKDAREKGVMATYSRSCNQIYSDAGLAKLPPPVLLSSVLRADGTYDAPYRGTIEDQEALGLVKDDGHITSPFSFRLRSWNAWTGNNLDFSNGYDLIVPKGNWVEYLIYLSEEKEHELTLITLGASKLAVALDMGGYEDMPVTSDPSTIPVRTFRFFGKPGYHRLKIKNTGSDFDARIGGLAIDAGSGLGRMGYLRNNLPEGKDMSFEEVVSNPGKIFEFLDSLTMEDFAYLASGQGSAINATGSVGAMPGRDVEALETSDGPAGLRLDTPQTAWPVEALLACTWDTEILYKIGEALREEMAAAGVALWLAPGLNIHRDPLCGRNFEYYSEDPYLTGTLAASIIKGVQSKGDRGVEMKHFCANNREENRLNNDSRVSERALREIYLKAFEIAVKEAQPWAIMASYNCFNGIHTAESKALLTDLLRGEWGFQGFVTTDWGSQSVGWKEIKAGCNVQMPWGESKELIAAYKAGLISLDELKASTRKILEIAAQYMRKVPRAPVKTAEQPEENFWRLKGSQAGRVAPGMGKEACRDETDGGENLTNISAKGAYMEFKLNVKQGGKYKVSLRFSSPYGTGGVKILLNGKEQYVWENTVKTGDWQKWETAENVTTIELPEGEQNLKFVSTGGHFNINYVDLKAE